MAALLFAALAFMLAHSITGLRSYDDRIPTAKHKKYSWKFGEHNDLIDVHNDTLPIITSEFPHFVLFLHNNGVTRSKRRLYEFEHLSREMKKELHPIPMGVNIMPDLCKDLNISESSLPQWVYFRHGEPIVYSGRQRYDDILEWMWRIRWPESEPITTQKKLSYFKHHSMVSVIYYGDNKLEEEYENFVHTISKFFNTHQRFGHVFKTELKKPYQDKLPCIEVGSHVHHADDDKIHESVICGDLSKERIEKFIEENRPHSHHVFQPFTGRKWFFDAHSNAIAFVHKGLKTDADKRAHIIFHKYMNKTEFLETKIGEININSVSF